MLKFFYYLNLMEKTWIVFITAVYILFLILLFSWICLIFLVMTRKSKPVFIPPPRNPKHVEVGRGLAPTHSTKNFNPRKSPVVNLAWGSLLEGVERK